MRCNYAMMSPKVTSPKEEEGANTDGTERDRAEWEGKVVESDCRDQNWALLHLTVA